MSSMNEEVSKLKNKIIECQEETLQLLHESQLWRDKSNLEEQAKGKALAALTRQVHCNSIKPSIFEQELEDLNKRLKQMEETESKLKGLFETRPVQYAEHKKSQEIHLIELERTLDKLESSYDESANIRLHKRRVEMEKRLESLDRFCEAVYSTVGLKESSTVSIVKEAQLDHPDGQKMRKRRGSKNSQ